MSDKFDVVSSDSSINVFNRYKEVDLRLNPYKTHYVKEIRLIGKKEDIVINNKVIKKLFEDVEKLKSKL